MRLSVALGCLLLVGCSGPRPTGELWAERLVEQETVLFRLSDAERTGRLRAFELGLVDETLGAERARISAGLSGCPGSEREALAPSVGDRVRDTARIQARGDPNRAAIVARIALSDWYLRRARATGDAHFCDVARQVLAAAGAAVTAQPPAGAPEDGGPLADLLRSRDISTVSRDPGGVGAEEADSVDASTTLSNYALGYFDTVRASAPLPQYLAAVYGGELTSSGATPDLNGPAAESLVDQFAPAYPDNEPDALYALLTAR